MPRDTIAAIATALGPGAVAIVRLSGPEAFALADRLCVAGRGGRPLRRAPSASPSHQARLVWLMHGDQALDQALLLPFRAPHSFTGEDVVEFQTHGGAVVASRVLEACLAEGARLAAPGEFSKRAYLNGRLDLAQAEALDAVVQARSEGALERALANLDGAFSRAVAELRAALVREVARIEAAIDYGHEVEDGGSEALQASLQALRGQALALAATAREGQAWREGVGLALVGRPNAGKSSLLNALAGRERALVSPHAGTTRDLLEEAVVLGGVPFRVVDAAGLRDTEDPVEAMGIERMRQAVEEAEVVALLVDLTQGVGPAEQELRALAGVRAVVVGTKVDLAGPGALADPPLVALADGAPLVAIASPQGEGLAALAQLLATQGLGRSPQSASPTVANARHRAALQQAEAHLAQAQAALAAGLGEDAVSMDLEAAIEALGWVSGTAVGEEVVSAIFSGFCVGK